MIRGLRRALVALFAIFGVVATSARSQTPPLQATQPPLGVAVAFDDLPGVAADDLAAAFAVFRASCAAVDGQLQPLKAAQSASLALRAVCREAIKRPAPLDDVTARAFFAEHFTPRQLPTSAFFTGYYEPVVEGSLTRTPDYATPLLALPDAFVASAAGVPNARQGPNGSLVPLPDRAAIETGALGAAAKPLVWVRAPVDAFFIQVQGSARILLPDGRLCRLAYAGRNGYPYTSIGKILVDSLHIPPDRMGMTELKSWIREHGQGPNDAGTNLMRANRSFIFFRLDKDLPPGAGPVGAAGVSLTPLRSLAIDRGIWSYGLPIYLATDLPSQQGDGSAPFRRMMVAEDTGSAIVGPARADIFFGTGPAAAARAGAVRQRGAMYVLWPKEPRAASPARPPG